jgi:hypothetical protein
MNKHRKRKLRNARHHTVNQRRKREDTLTRAIEAAYHLGANGKRLKKDRTADKAEPLVREYMGKEGYVPNGKGGWRSIAKQKQGDLNV